MAYSLQLSVFILETNSLFCSFHIYFWSNLLKYITYHSVTREIRLRNCRKIEPQNMHPRFLNPLDHKSTTHVLHSVLCILGKSKESDPTDMPVDTLLTHHWHTQPMHWLTCWLMLLMHRWCVGRCIGKIDQHVSWHYQVLYISHDCVKEYLFD